MLSGEMQRKRNESRSQLHGFVRLYPNPFMDEVRVKAVVLCDACNRRAGLSALLDYLGLEGFGIRSALWLHGKTRLKARNGVHLN